MEALCSSETPITTYQATWHLLSVCYFTTLSLARLHSGER
jgi:hypothetical protein